MDVISSETIYDKKTAIWRGVYELNPNMQKSVFSQNPKTIPWDWDLHRKGWTAISQLLSTTS